VARATLTSKGQITLPKDVREKLELESGDQIDFVVMPDGNVILKPAKIDILKLEGLLRNKNRKPVSIAQMNAAIRARAKKLR
jgi:antitoxin PrlF